MLGLGRLELSDIELQLFSFENVTIRSTRLSGSRGDAGVESTGLELRFEERVDLGGLLSSRESSLDVRRLDLDFLLSSGDDLSSTTSQLAVECGQELRKSANLDTLLRDRNGVMGLVPSSERSGIDLDDSGLGDGVGSYLRRKTRVRS